MLRGCFLDKCTKKAIITCSCTDKEICICSLHVGKHTKSKGIHHLKNIMIKLDENQTDKILIKAKNLLNHLKESKNSIQANSKLLIEFIENTTKSYSIAIRNIEKGVIDTIKRVISRKSIDEELHDYILDSNEILISTYDDFISIKKHIKNYLKKNFEIFDWRCEDSVIFSKANNIGDLYSIDLKSFKTSSLDYTPKIGNYCQACKINKNIFFFQGGYMDTYHGEAYVINTKKKKYEKFKNGYPKVHGCLVLKDNKIYSFGGFDGSSLNTCEAFDFNTKEWNSIHELPQASYYNNATLLRNNIIITGYYFKCAYSYNDSVFTNILNLKSYTCSVACEGWILQNSILYENQEQDLLKWTPYNINNPWNAVLLIGATFKRNNYIFFIDGYSFLMRIDTKMKILEKIDYSC